jgi:hypothetical protein
MTKYRKKATLNEMKILYQKFVGIQKIMERFDRYKKTKYGKKTTLAERRILFNKLVGGASATKLAEKGPTKAGFQKYLEQFRAYKKQTKGVSKITESEFVGLKKKYLAKFNEGKAKAGTFEKLVENYKKYKKAKGLGEAVSYGELKTLKTAFKKNPKIREAGEEFAADPNMAGAVDAAAPMTDPNMAGAEGAVQVAPEVTAAIQGIKDQVEQLATQVGIQDVNDNLGGDAAAGVPPVDGMGAVPGADGQQPTLESRKGRPNDRISAIRERINKRAKALKETSDMGGLTGAAHEQAAVGIMDLGPAQNGDGASGATNESPFAKIPSSDKLADGFDGEAGAEAGETWPTKDAVPGEGQSLQGEGARVTESIEDVTKRYVDRHLQPKLNFSSLKDALKAGRLG